MCFVSNEDKMEQFNACVLKGHMKDRNGKKVHISELPKSFFDLQNDAQVQIVFRKVSLEGYFRLPPWGMDYQRSYELMTSIDANGDAILTDLTGSKVKVTIDEATIERALKLKPGQYSLTDKITETEKRATFLQLKGGVNTYKDLVMEQVILPLQIYAQHFTLTKPVRYTKPSVRMATLFTKALAGKLFSPPHFSRYILSEMIQHSSSKGVKDSPYLGAGC